MSHNFPNSSKLSVSLIITTYKWSEALSVTLNSILSQSIYPEEIIIADDGSGTKTAQAVINTLKSSDLRWCHVRQNDKGIRQARIKNLGVKYSRSRYLIFIDHDVALHPDFISDHIHIAEKGFFLQGKRSFLPEVYTIKILSEGIFRQPSLLIRGLENRKNAFRSQKIGRILAREKEFQTSLRGCNLSMFKDDFIEIDGYDETFDQLWGREDSDICYRLFHRGVKCKNLWFSALQYHLYHRVTKNREKDRLDRELDKIIQEKRVKAVKGFSQLSSEGEIISASKDFDLVAIH